jgi:hypothetical protein
MTTRQLRGTIAAALIVWAVMISGMCIAYGSTQPNDGGRLQVIECSTIRTC